MAEMKLDSDTITDFATTVATKVLECLPANAFEQAIMKPTIEKIIAQCAYDLVLKTAQTPPPMPIVKKEK